MIRPALLAWQGITEQILKLSPQVSDSQRDEMIANVEAFLDERDKLQQQIAAPFTPEEEVLGKELVALEVDIQKKLAQLTKEIRVDISESQLKSDNMKSYVNPYSSLGQDGTYYDTKQ